MGGRGRRGAAERGAGRAAGGLAAALSTAAGLLLAIASAISHDLLKRTFMPEISDPVEHGNVLHLAGREWFVHHTPGHTLDRSPISTSPMTTAES